MMQTNLRKNIVLIGYRCTGKSKLGRLLADKTKRPLYSSDKLAEERLGISIREFIETKGSWQAFRDLESEVIEELSRRQEAIIDCGGGVIEREGNIDLLKQSGLIFWLTAPIEVIEKRLKAVTDRPSLTQNGDPVAEAKKVLAKRIPLYQQAADHVIDVSGEDQEAKCRSILQKIGI